MYVQSRTLFEIFGRLEAFSQQQEIHSDAVPDQKMVDTVTKIMVEVSTLLELLQKNSSKAK